MVGVLNLLHMLHMGGRHESQRASWASRVVIFSLSRLLTYSMKQNIYLAPGTAHTSMEAWMDSRECPRSIMSLWIFHANLISSEMSR